MKRSRQNHFQSERGIALILSLAVLGVLLLLVVAFAVSMRTEQVAARNNSYVMAARQLAEAGVADAVCLIRTNTPLIDATHNFVTQPGRAERWQPPPLPNPNDLLLFSIASTPQPYNINSDRSIIPPNTTYALAANREISVEWINVCENGKQLGAPGNPLIGRYAFWVDDEASKININAASLRKDSDSDSLLGKTTKEIDLRAVNIEGAGFTATYANDTHAYAQDPGFFTTEQWKEANGVTATRFLNNAFYLTAYSKDIPLTPWGALRVNLNSALFNDIVHALKDPALGTWFPATDFGTQNFAQKYGVNGSRSMAARIIDFRTPLPGGPIDPNPSVTTDNVDDPTYAGLKETPLINELILKGTIDKAAPSASIQLQVELVYPNPNYPPYLVPPPPLPPARGANYQLTVQYTIEDSANSGLPGFTAGPPQTYSATQTATLIPNMNPGTYDASLNVNLYQSTDPAIAAMTTSPTLKVTIQKILLKNAATPTPGLVDFARNLVIPHPSAAPNTLTVLLDGTVATRSIEANDPRANDYMTTDDATAQPLWSDRLSPTPGAQNGAYKLTGASKDATDLTDDGTETTPLSSPVTHSNYYIKNAAFQSVGELGYIHTGRPWRSLRLQPRAAGNNIPDWAVLDLFCIDQTPMLGRININADVFHYPGGTPTAMTTKRLVPLLSTTGSIANSAYVQGSWPNAGTLITEFTALANRTWVSSYTVPTAPASPWPSFAGLAGTYAMLGQICEVDGIANKVKVGNAITDANREARVAQIANLLTLRSNTFTVWAVGQAILDANKDGVYKPADNDQIVGEAKAQFVIDRVQDPGPDAIYGTGDDKVSYRTLYFRYVTR